MFRKITIVHGIHTNDTDGWMYYIRDRFTEAGWDARVWTYGNVNALTTRLFNPGRADNLAAILEPGEVVLGHSNGCTLTYMASQKVPLGGAILLNPALDRDKVVAPPCPWINLYKNKFDVAVKLAGFIPKHPWGPQGREGLLIDDSRYYTVETSEEYPFAIGHSGILEPEKLPFWTGRIIEDAEARIHAETIKSKTSRT